MASLRGDAGLVWARTCELAIQQKIEEALAVCTEVEEKSKRLGITVTQAAAATSRAVVGLCRSPDGQAFMESLRGLGATWGEASLLLTDASSNNLPDPGDSRWGEAVKVAKKALAQASPDVAQAISLAHRLGLAWTPTLQPRRATSQSSAPLGAADATSSPAKAMALKELGRMQEAGQAAMEAAKTYREKGNLEGEATSLLVKSAAFLGRDNMLALQAANHALKLFKELGHYVGQTASLHALAKAQLAKHSTDEALGRAAEALRLCRSLGDRLSEAQLVVTAASAALASGAGRKALGFLENAIPTARVLEDRLLEADLLCLVAKARAVCNEPGAAAAKEALAIYEALGLPERQLHALEALIEACKAKQNTLDATACGESLASIFRAASKRKEEAKVSVLLSRMHSDLGDLDPALAAAEAAISVFQAAEDVVGQAKAQTLSASIFLDRKDFDEALVAARKAAALFEQSGALDEESREGQLTCISTQAFALAQLGKFSEALQYLDEQLRRFRGTKDKRGEGRVLLISAQLLQAQGRLEQALSALATAAPMLAAAGDRSEAKAWHLSTQIYMERKDLSKALAATEMSALAYRKAGDKRGRAQIAALMAEIQFLLCGVEKAREGSLEEAKKASKEAVALFQDLREKSVELGYCLHCLANINLALHDFEAALRTAEEALDLFRTLREPMLETTALLMESAAYVGLQDFEQSRLRANEAKEIYEAAGAGKGADSVDEWLQSIEKYAKGELKIRNFHGFSMRRTYGTPVAAQREQRQSFKPPRRLGNINDIELMIADDSKTTRSTIIIYQGLEHRSGVASQTATKKVTAAELEAFGVSADKDLEYDVRWVHRHKSKNYSKGKRLQVSDEALLAASGRPVDA
ncbi:RPL35 [Symbiodinium natans]|uniref:RPL35 protein n=1 Tax=Symbiodinium natans TaxID=878477 RepID=A0A812MWW4_9DINO|nr:RPL35 [Symbiodinium natans]